MCARFQLFRFEVIGEQAMLEEMICEQTAFRFQLFRFEVIGELAGGKRRQALHEFCRVSNYSDLK